MLVSHEVPFCLVNKSFEFNDYDYFLVHLLKEYPKYGEYFRESNKRGRRSILDNSIFELGKAFDEEEFTNYIEEYEPSEYIIPDVLEDAEATAENFIRWRNINIHLKGVRIGVVQGKTLEELEWCYKELDNLADKIAIGFNYSFYETHIKNGSKLEKWMRGRQFFIDYLISNNIINRDKPHHLLGCSLVQEFSYYKLEKYSFIESLDTSNPIVHGIKNIIYQKYGLDVKENVKLADLMEIELDCSQESDINFNIKKFKSFC